LDKNQPNPIVELFMTGALSFHPKELSLGVVNKFHDADLRRVETPTLLLIGEHETTYTLKPAKVIERARRLIPHLEAALIPHGRHLFPVDQADETNVRLLAFLTG
jgi:pimeloyl-ACP methyl ester carboxylesterase